MDGFNYFSTGAILELNIIFVLILLGVYFLAGRLMFADGKKGQKSCFFFIGLCYGFMVAADAVIAVANYKIISNRPLSYCVIAVQLISVMFSDSVLLIYYLRRFDLYNPSKRWIYWILRTPAIVMSVLIIVSLFNGMLFNVNEFGVGYEKTPYFIVFFIVHFFYSGSLVAISLYKLFTVGNDIFEKKRAILLLCYPVMVVSFGAIQDALNLSVTCFGLIVSVLVVFAVDMVFSSAIMNKNLTESIAFSDIMLKPFSSSFGINLLTKEYTVYKCTPVHEEIAKKHKNFNDAFNEYIERYIVEEDKQKLSEITSSTIYKKLTIDNSFSVEYRDKSGEQIRTFRMRINRGVDENHVIVGFTDVSDEANEMRERKRQFDNMLKYMPATAFTKDALTGQYMVCNELFAKYAVNGKPSDVIGKSDYDLFDKETADHFHEDDMNAVTSDGPMIFREDTPDSNGDIHHFQTTKVCFSDGEGRKYVLGMSIDISDTILLQNKVDELQARKEFHDIIEIMLNNYECIFLYDVETESIKLVSAKDNIIVDFEKYVNSDSDIESIKEEIVNEYAHPEDASMLLSFLEPSNICNELKDKKESMIVFRRKFGNAYKYVSVKAGKKEAKEERPKQIVIGFEMVDDQVRANEEQHAIIDNFTSDFACVYYLSVVRNKREMITSQYRTNQMFVENIPGWTSETSFRGRINLLCEYFVAPDGKDAFLQQMSRDVIIEKLTTDDVYFVNFLANGIGVTNKYYQFKFTSVKNKNNGKLKGMVVGLRCIDEEKKKELDFNEKLMREKARAEKASQAKTDFLFNMSHDIRTPMNAIDGFTDLALHNMDNPKLCKEYLEKSKSASGVLISLINDILDMSRIESGKIVLADNKVNVNQIFSEIKPILEESAKSKNIDLSFSVSDIEDEFVHADCLRTDRILMNLITNALKYTPEGGTVNVSVKQTGRKHDTYGVYRFVISDNGIGMSEEFQKVAFDEFTREVNSTTNNVQGTGLGLSLVKKLVELMKGSIKLKSTVGKGTTFTVDLPLKLQVGEEITDEDTLPEDIDDTILIGKRVLLVEDNELNREIANAILTSEKMIVEEAINGFEAVATILNKGIDYYDVVLMDIQMPKMNGYEASKRIHELFPETQLPIIALSANAFEEDKAKSKTMGMVAHIAKPINAKEFIATINSVLK